MNKIIWLEDVSNCDYVREGHIYCRQMRKSKPAFTSTNTSRLVGYEEGGSNGYRKIYTLRDYDRDRDPNGCYKDLRPCKAVDPKTLYGKGIPNSEIIYEG